MTEMDEKEFEEWWEDYYKTNHPPYSCKEYIFDGFLAGRRTLREQIKSDPNIGRLEISDWPESPDY